MRYILKHKDVDVALVEYDKVLHGITRIHDVMAMAHFPVGIDAIAKELNLWWQSRGIPLSRMGLKGALTHLGVDNIRELSINSMGLNLSDQYWLCPAYPDQRIVWRDINFFQNDFDESIGRAMFGEKSFAIGDRKTPDSSTDGNLPKRWTIKDGERILIKGGARHLYEEPFAEVFANRVAAALRATFVPYSLGRESGRPASLCPCFVTESTELIYAYEITEIFKKKNHVSPFRHYIDSLKALDVPFDIKDIDRMIVLDFLISNTDRHYHNFGAVRNADTLEFIGLAPIYDSGNSMFANTSAAEIMATHHVMSANFRNTQEKMLGLVSSFECVCPSRLREAADTIYEIYEGNEYIDQDRINLLRKMYLARVDAVEHLSVNNNMGYETPATYIKADRQGRDETDNLQKSEILNIDEHEDNAER
jgi:hypothetical protein